MVQHYHYYQGPKFKWQLVIIEIVENCNDDKA